MIRTMLVAIDAAGETEGVLDLAAAVCRAFGASARVLCVVDPGYAVAPSDDPLDDGPAAVDEQRLADRLIGTAVAALRAAGVQADGQVLPGDEPAAAILEAARAEGVGAIVLGHGARSWLGRLTGGSVATSVLEAASCPVFVAPASMRSGALA